MIRRAITALCHFRSVIPPLVKGDEGGFSASIPRHARQWLSGIDLQKKRKVKSEEYKVRGMDPRYQSAGMTNLRG